MAARIMTRTIQIFACLLTCTAIAQVPPGFKVTNRSGAVTTYRQDWFNGIHDADFVTVAKLDTGAIVRNITGRWGSDDTIQNNPFGFFKKQAWNYNTADREAITLFNGTFYARGWKELFLYTYSHISFGLKCESGTIFGFDRRPAGEVKLLCYNTQQASAQNFSTSTFSNWSNVIGAFSADVPRNDSIREKRNWFGLRDGDRNGTLDTIVFYYSNYANRADAIDVLGGFGCAYGTMGFLDTGGSASYWVKGTGDAASMEAWRGVPHMIAIYARPPTNNASFVTDLNYPDGTVVAPGESFTKRWRIRDSGNTTWGGNSTPSDGYHWSFDGGDHLGAPASIDTPPINPGDTWDPAVPLRAPTTPGTYRGYWRMTSPSGSKFGDRCWVDIRVVSGETIYVHDNGPGFTLFGPSQYWWRDNGGGLDGFWYTYSNGPTVSNYAQWRPTLPHTARYRVEVMVPERHATTRSARYEVNHRNGHTIVTVNQSLYFRQWVSLGEFDFNIGSGGYIQLTDMTGEPYSWYSIGFDAIRFVRV